MRRTKEQIEQMLIEQVTNELGMEVAKQENLLQVGAGSLVIMRILAYWKKAGYDINYSDLFRYPTIDQWAELIFHANLMTPKNFTEIVKDMYQPFELTDVQYAYWVGRWKENFLGNVGCHGYFEVDTKELDIIRLQAAWNILFTYHPMLRAKFLSTGQQVIMKQPYQSEISVFDLAGLTESDQESELAKIRAARSHRLLKIEEGQVISLAVSKRSAHQARLHFDIDLLVCDVQSFQIILRDLANYYLNMTLPPVKKEWNFAAYLENQKTQNQSLIQKDQLFWKDRQNTLPEGPILSLKSEKLWSQATQFRRFSYQLSEEKKQALIQKAKQAQITLATLFLTAYSYTVSKWSENKRFLMNVPLFNRNSEEPIAEVVADFTSVVLVPVDFSEKNSFHSYAQATQEQFQASIDHSAYSGIQIMRDLKRAQKEFASPYVVFSCNLGKPLIADEFKQAFGNLGFMISQTPQALIDFQLFDHENGLHIIWDTVEDAFPDGVVTEMFDLMIRVLETLSEDEYSWQTPLEILSNSQMNHLAQTINFEPERTVSTTMVTGILKQAIKNPNAIALIDPVKNQMTTYQELIQASQRIAGYLKSVGIQKNTRIAILTERRMESVAAMLAVQLCGCSYIPIQSTQPPERLTLILQSANVKQILAFIPSMQKYRAIPDLTWLELEQGINYPSAYLANDANPEESAYIIFTSGSTGTPKGVEVTHKAAMNTILTMNHQYQVTDSDRAIGVSAYDFDLSVYDIYGLLHAGGSLLLVPQDSWRTADAWLEWIQKYQVTLWNSVPALLKMLLVKAEYAQIELPSFRLILLSGDWIDLDLPERINAIATNAKLVALGGATEAAIWSNYLDVPAEIPMDWNSIPYGQPLTNQFYRVVDSKGEECPDYVNGELLIGGLGIAKGYVGNAELTAASFIKEYGQRWYRTGDIGRFWQDGTLEFMGRIDNQIKIQGHRVELGEIEVKIREYPAVKDCAVLHVSEYSSQQLAAFFIPELSKETTANLEQKQLDFTQLTTDYNAASDQTFFDYCRYKRGEILKQITTELEEHQLNILPEYQPLFKQWQAEIQQTSLTSVVALQPEVEMTLANFLNPLLQKLPDVFCGKTALHQIVQQKDFISPNEIAQQTEGGRYTEVLFAQIIEEMKMSRQAVHEQPLKILEIGARTPAVTLNLVTRFPDLDYVLLDTSKYYLDLAKKKIGEQPHISYLAYDYEEVIIPELEQIGFDLIIMNNTLHQVKNIPTALENIFTYLNPEGLLLFAEMAVEFPLEDLTTGLFKRNLEDQRQLTGRLILNCQEWQELAKQNGLTIRQIYPEQQDNYPLYVYLLQNPLGDQSQIISGLEEYLKHKLPYYMLPANYYALTSFPVTANGKLDRKALCQHIKQSTDTLEKDEMTSVEYQLAAIWEKLLQTTIQKESNYFRLGGDSLLATQLSAEIEKQFHVPFSIETVFEQQTLSEMAEYLAEKIGQEVAVESESLKFIMKPDQRFDPFPLTDVQQAYLLGQSEAFTFGGVSTQCYFEFDCMDLNLPKAEAAFNRLIVEHDMLRGVILPNGQQQIIKEAVQPFKITVYDLHTHAAEHQAKELSNVRQEMSQLKYDRYTWPLYDIRVAKITETKSRLFVSFDNILIDGWSMFYILKEWSYLYSNPDDQVNGSSISFRDYVLNYEALRSSGAHDQDWSYWMSKVDELYPAPELPVVTGSMVEQPKFARYQAKVPAAIWQTIKSYIQNNALTPAALLLAAYAEVLDRWSLSDQFSINLTNFNRVPFHQEVNQLVGDFTALTIHGINMNSASTFLQRAKIIQKKMWEDLNHSYVSGVEIERFLNKRGSNGMMPIVFTCGLGLDNNLERDYTGYLGEMVYGLSNTPQVWLDNQVSEENGDLLVSWDALQSIFPARMVDEMFAAYIDFIKRLGMMPEIWQQTSGELVDVQNTRACELLNQTAGPIADFTLIDCFYQTVTQYQDRLAIETDSESFTYTQINQLSNALANQLLAQQVNKGDCIALYLKKGWQQIIAILAILKCGAIYLPLKYDNPVERNRKILKEAGVKGVLVASSEAANPLGLSDDIWTLPIGKNYFTNDIFIKQSSDDVAYIIYTSGTTGVPKGVAITHQAVLNTIVDVNARIAASNQDKTIALSDISFDLSVYDIFGMFLVGGSIVIPEHEKIQEPGHWVELVDKYQVTIWNSVPMYMSMYTTFIKGKSLISGSSIRVGLLSGDWIPLDSKQAVTEAIGRCDLYGLGGATEAAIWSNIFKIEQVLPEWTSIPYGKPLKNQRYYVYDGKLRRRPNSVPGDLYIGGLGLAVGYWKNQAATTASFINNSLTNERLYRTGDLAQYMPDGNIQFCGRVDNQVKINGFRIELEEINLALRQLLPIEKVISIVKDTKIIAYIQPEIEYDQESVLREMRQYLPAYMLPNRIVALKDIPLSENGKIDLKKLIELSQRLPERVAIISEMTAIEREVKQIWESVLEEEVRDIQENYLSLGGDSLKAIKMLTIIDQKYHIELSLNDFYEHATVRQLAAFLSNRMQDSDLGEI